MIYDFKFIRVTPLIIKEKTIKNNKNIKDEFMAWTPKKETMPKEYEKYINPICIRERFYDLLTKEELRAIVKHEALHLFLEHKDSFDIDKKEYIKEVFVKNEDEVDSKLSKKEFELIDNAKKKYFNKFLIK